MEMRFFGGLKVGEIAEILDVTSRTVVQHWKFAQACLYRDRSVNPEGCARRSARRIEGEPAAGLPSPTEIGLRPLLFPVVVSRSGKDETGVAVIVPGRPAEVEALPVPLQDLGLLEILSVPFDHGAKSQDLHHGVSLGRSGGLGFQHGVGLVDGHPGGLSVIACHGDLGQEMHSPQPPQATEGMGARLHSFQEFLAQIPGLIQPALLKEADTQQPLRADPLIGVTTLDQVDGPIETPLGFRIVGQKSVGVTEATEDINGVRLIFVGFPELDDRILGPPLLQEETPLIIERQFVAGIQVRRLLQGPDCLLESSLTPQGVTQEHVALPELRGAGDGTAGKLFSRVQHGRVRARVPEVGSMNGSQSR